MPNRRKLLVAAAVLAITGGAAQAQSWKAQYPELVLAVVPAENSTANSSLATRATLSPARAACWMRRAVSRSMSSPAS